jgi:hypothetical protein
MTNRIGVIFTAVSKTTEWCEKLQLVKTEEPTGLG